MQQFPICLRIRSHLNSSVLDLRQTPLFLTNLIALRSPELPVCSSQVLSIVGPLQSCSFCPLPTHWHMYFSLPPFSYAISLTNPRPLRPSWPPFALNAPCGVFRHFPFSPERVWSMLHYDVIWELCAVSQIRDFCLWVNCELLRGAPRFLQQLLNTAGHGKGPILSAHWAM